MQPESSSQSAPSSADAEHSADAERSSSGRAPARERLLAAADELFYKEGVHTVGIDRVIERAGVAKASLYSTFGSKDQLICGYLARRAAARRERIAQVLASYDTPRERVLGVFEMLGELFAEPGFHGCAFMNASAEASPDSPIQDAATEYRAWVRALFVDLVRPVGVAEPDRLARQLVLLYDGATISASMEHDPNAASLAREAAATLLDAAVNGSASGSSSSAN